MAKFCVVSCKNMLVAFAQLSLCDDNPFPSCEYKNYHETSDIGSLFMQFLENGQTYCYNYSYLIAGNDIEVTRAYRYQINDAWTMKTYSNPLAFIDASKNGSNIYKVSCKNGVSQCSYQIALIKPSLSYLVPKTEFKLEITAIEYVTTKNTGNKSFNVNFNFNEGHRKYYEEQGIFVYPDNRQFTVTLEGKSKVNNEKLIKNETTGAYEAFTSSLEIDCENQRPPIGMNSGVYDQNGTIHVQYIHRPMPAASILAWNFDEFEAILPCLSGVYTKDNLDSAGKISVDQCIDGKDNDEGQPNKKSNTLLIILVVIGIVVFICAIGAVYYMVLKGKTKHGKEIFTADTEKSQPNFSEPLTE